MGSFFLTMILILAIAIVFDISEKIDDFQNGATMNEIVFDYYINFIAFYGNLFSALILFISTIWFTSRIASTLCDWSNYYLCAFFNAQSPIGATD